MGANMTAWVVLIPSQGKDNVVFFDSGMSASEVKEALVSHDHLPPDIIVKKLVRKSDYLGCPPDEDNAPAASLCCAPAAPPPREKLPVP